MNINSKIWLEKDGKPILGAGRLNLLKAVDREGSISKAAKMMNISFRRAWSALESAEKNIGIKLLERRKGGAGGGSSCLTPQAKILIRKFDQLIDDTKTFSTRRFKSLFDEVKDDDFDV
jgi:molybdate transport system regulatory protein